MGRAEAFLESAKTRTDVASGRVPQIMERRKASKRQQGPKAYLMGLRHGLMFDPDRRNGTGESFSDLVKRCQSLLRLLVGSGIVDEP